MEDPEKDSGLKCSKSEAIKDQEYVNVQCLGCRNRLQYFNRAWKNKGEDILSWALHPKKTEPEEKKLQVLHSKGINLTESSMDTNKESADVRFNVAAKP
jgi:hypothetical protein